MIEAKAKDDALFRLVRELKYKTNYKFIDETSFEIQLKKLNNLTYNENMLKKTKKFNIFIVYVKKKQ